MNGSIESGSSIFLLQDGAQGEQKLVEMAEAPYDSEEWLQRLLASYPHLIPGEQIDPSSPRSWLLLSREVGIAFEQGSDRWSVDHVLIDQDGVPTLVEVKRSTDTRIRREVVGQVLEYAASALEHWTVELLHARFLQRYADDQAKGEAVLASFLEKVGVEEAHFWESVKTNLKAGKIRLVFLADEIPPELRRIISFLSSQMDPAEVLAVEIKQYVDASRGLRMLVPRVVAQRQPSLSSGEGGVQWDEATFFPELVKTHPEDVEVARALLDWAKSRATRVWWGKGKTMGSFVPVIERNGVSYQPITVYTTGVLYVNLSYLAGKPGFEETESQREVLERLNSVPGIEIPEERLGKQPPVKLSVLRDKTALALFLSAWDWVAERIRNS